MKAKTKSFLMIILILLALFIGFVVFIVISRIQESSPYINEKTKQKVSDCVIEYLDEMYGDNNYKIDNIEKNYIYYGFVSSHHGYEATVSSLTFTCNFKAIVNYDESGTNMIVTTENFVEEFYEESTDKFISQKFDSNFDISIKEEKIPNNIGHFPSISELESFGAIDGIYIESNIYSDYSFNTLDEKLDFILDISKSLINYFKIDDNLNYRFLKSDGIGSNYYDIEINDETIKIYNNTNIEKYEFPRD